MTRAGERDPAQPPDEYFDSERRELLVATPHADLVRATLLTLGLEDPYSERSSWLGLTRLRLTENFAIDGKVERRAKAYADRIGGIVVKDDDPVGMVLSAVKETLSQQWAGWIPTMGRNRMVGHVTGTDGAPIISSLDPVTVPDRDHLDPGAFIDLELFTERGARRSLKGDGVRVGIVDTTLHPHPWLEGARVQPQPVSFGADSKRYVRSSHCAAMLGIILQHAPGAEIDVVGVLGDEGWTTAWNAANAIASFRSSDIDILNLSFSCYTANGDPPLALAAAIDRLDPRTVVVAAAGNVADGGRNPRHPLDLSRAPAWPAALDDVVAVGAVVPVGGASGWDTADFSPQTPWVDVVAPGAGVLSLLVGVPGGADKSVTGPVSSLPEVPTFARWSGTSPATAHVTGKIAAKMSRKKVPARVAWDRLGTRLPELCSGPYHPKLLV